MKHGMSATKTYGVWAAMRQRCQNEKAQAYDMYGARGIKVCDRWQSFANFLADMGEKPKGKSLDRLDVNGDYEPSNCRWATPKEQSANRRDNVMIEMNGERLCLAEWCRRKRLVFDTVWCRIFRHGWTPHEALTRPVKHSEGDP